MSKLNSCCGVPSTYRQVPEFQGCRLRRRDESSTLNGQGSHMWVFGQDGPHYAGEALPDWTHLQIGAWRSQITDAVQTQLRLYPRAIYRQLFWTSSSPFQRVPFPFPPQGRLSTSHSSSPGPLVARSFLFFFLERLSRRDYFERPSPIMSSRKFVSCDAPSSTTTALARRVSRGLNRIRTGG